MEVVPNKEVKQNFKTNLVGVLLVLEIALTKWTATHNVVQVKFLNQPSVRLNYLYLVSYPNYLVDCLWDTWQSWSSCTKSCGIGTKLRSRSKVQDVLCGGTACSGNSVEQVNCNTQCCSGNDLEFDFMRLYPIKGTGFKYQMF